MVNCKLFSELKFIVSLPKPAVDVSLLKQVLMETQNIKLHNAVIIIHNLITKEIVDDVNSGSIIVSKNFWISYKTTLHH